jgi:hypothetical protein
MATLPNKKAKGSPFESVQELPLVNPVPGQTPHVAIIGSAAGVGKSDVTNRLIGHRCSPSARNALPITQVPISFKQNTKRSGYVVSVSLLNGDSADLSTLTNIGQIYNYLV